MILAARAEYKKVRCLMTELCQTGTVTVARLDKKQPNSERRRHWIWPRFEPLTTSLVYCFPLIPRVSGLIPSPSAVSVPCWSSKCQHQALETQTVPEYPHQLASQLLRLHDTPHAQSQHSTIIWYYILHIFLNVMNIHIVRIYFWLCRFSELQVDP